MSHTAWSFTNGIFIPNVQTIEFCGVLSVNLSMNNWYIVCESILGYSKSTSISLVSIQTDMGHSTFPCQKSLRLLIFIWQLGLVKENA